MSAVQRAAAFVVAVLAVAIVIVVLLSGTDGGIGRVPDGTPTVTPDASATENATPDATASATADASATPGDILAGLEEIEQQVIEIRGLPAPDIGPAEILGRDELAAEMQALFEAEYPPEDRERDNFVVRAFGLLGPHEDIAELQLELLTEQVVGFYDTEDRRMVIVSDTGLNAEAKITYAHEYTHALQDAAFGLDSLETDAVGEDDRSLARVALVEGDATVTMLAWAIEHLTPQELQEISGTPVPDTADVPGWMMSQLMFPYLAGQAWILEIMDETGGTLVDPEYTAVDAAFGDPPTSTAQILDVEKWHDRVEPVEVETPDLAAALGEGWEEVDAPRMGQATISIILEHFGVSRFDTQDAAEQWTGDRAVVVRGPDDAFALAWRVAFATEDEAAQFESAYATVVDALDFPALASRDGETVLVAHASDMDLLRRTVDAAR